MSNDNQLFSGLTIVGCDGVLLNTEGLLAVIVAAELRKYGLGHSVSDVQRDFVGLTPLEIMAEVNVSLDAKGQEPLDADFAYRIEGELEDYPLEHIQALPGVHDFISQVPDIVCLAHNAGPARVWRQMEATGLSTTFEDRAFVLGLGEEVVDPVEAYIEIAGHFGYSPQQVTVADTRLLGLVAAQKAGCNVIALTGGGSRGPYMERGFHTALGLSDFAPAAASQ